MLGQTYLSRKTSFEKKGKLPLAHYVFVAMSFSPHLAPSKEILDDYKKTGNWEDYAERFNNKIMSDPVALEELDKLILESMTSDVILVCYESEKKFLQHCHRFLLLDIAEMRSKEVLINWENYLK